MCNKTCDNIAGLAISRSRVRIPAAPLSSATLGKLLTHMPLSLSIMLWYQPMGGDALRLGREVGLTSHWPCVIDFSGSPHMGSRPWIGRWAPTPILSSKAWTTLPLVLCEIFVQQLVMICRQLVSSPQSLLTLAGPLTDDGSSKPAATPGGPKHKHAADLALLKL